MLCRMKMSFDHFTLTVNLFKFYFESPVKWRSNQLFYILGPGSSMYIVHCTCMFKQMCVLKRDKKGAIFQTVHWTISVCYNGFEWMVKLGTDRHTNNIRCNTIKYKVNSGPFYFQLATGNWHLESFVQSKRQKYIYKFYFWIKSNEWLSRTIQI